MSILQRQSFTVTLLGDGTSTSVTFDMKDRIAPTGVLPNVPSVLGPVVAPSGFTLTGQSLNGTKVTLDFSPAPSNVQGPFEIDLYF